MPVAASVVGANLGVQVAGGVTQQCTFNQIAACFGISIFTAPLMVSANITVSANGSITLAGASLGIDAVTGDVTLGGGRIGNGSWSINNDGSADFGLVTNCHIDPTGSILINDIGGDVTNISIVGTGSAVLNASGSFSNDNTILNNDGSGQLGFISYDATGNITTTGWIKNTRFVTAPGTSAVASGNSNGVFTNEGAGAQVDLTLPTAVAGLTYTFHVQAAFTLKVIANAGDTIRIGPSVSAAAGFCSTAVVGNSVTLTAINATEWVATSFIGVWTVT